MSMPLESMRSTARSNSNLGLGQHSLAVVGVAGGVGCFNLLDEHAHALLLGGGGIGCGRSGGLRREEPRAAPARWPAAAGWLERRRVSVGVQPASGKARQGAGRQQEPNPGATRMEKRGRRGLDGVTLGTMPMISYAMEARCAGRASVQLSPLF